MVFNNVGKKSEPTGRGVKCGWNSAYQILRKRQMRGGNCEVNIGKETSSGDDNSE